jgi:Tfp pilus assembly protein PilO
VSLTTRDRKILIGVIPILVIAAYWFLVLSPKREEAATASAELTVQQDRLAAAQSLSQAAEGAKRDFEVSYAQVVRLGKAIPSSVDMPSLLVQLDAAAAGTGIHFTKISTGDRVPAPVAAPATPPAESGSESAPAADAGGTPAQTAPGAAAESANNAQQTANADSAAAEQSGVAPADTQTSTSADSGLPVGGGAAATGDPAAAGAAPGLETVPLELEFVGNFFNLADFFHRVKRFVRVANRDVLVSGRLLTVEGVRWASDSEIFPRIRAEVTATIYLSPKAQGVTAGATPTGPAPTTAATAAPAGSAPAPAAAPAPATTAASPTATSTP